LLVRLLTIPVVYSPLTPYYSTGYDPSNSALSCWDLQPSAPHHQVLLYEYLPPPDLDGYAPIPPVDYPSAITDPTGSSYALGDEQDVHPLRSVHFERVPRGNRLTPVKATRDNRMRQLLGTWRRNGDRSPATDRVRYLLLPGAAPPSWCRSRTYPRRARW